ncbi:MAG TPA: peptidoglycan-binding domain-containing protein [Candidatus Paceibacterota bacterium]
MYKTLTAFFVTLIASVAFVQAQSVTVNVSPNNFTINAGEQRTVNLSGANTYFLGSNSNPAVASAIVQGSFVTITAVTAGTNSVSVCAYDTNNSVTCAPINFTVQKTTTTTQQQTQTAQTATISFNTNQVTVNVGQIVRITASGSGTGLYYVSDINNPSAVSAWSDGSNSIAIQGSSVGGSNVTVCQSGGACGNIYAFVPSTSTNLQAVTTTALTHPGLSAFYIASNGAQFLSRNSVLTIKFNTTADITSNVVRVGSQSVQVNGTSSGPYSATYTLTGNEVYPLPVSIDFWAADGTAGHTSFAISDTGMPVQTGASTPASSGTAVTFTKALHNGSVGSEVSALQTLLKRLGYFSGPVTGNYGPITVASVKKYQAAHGLDQLGSVGPGTRAALNRE